MIADDPIPGRFTPWFVRGTDRPLGYVEPKVSAVLCVDGLFEDCGDHLLLEGTVSLTEQLDKVRSSLLLAGCVEPPRGEEMSVCYAPGEPAVARIDRSAMRILGLWATKVHVNGLVWPPGSPGPDVWVSRRSLSATAAPGFFDTLVAGGSPAGSSLTQTMIRESGEEVGIPPCLAETARHMATLEAIYTSAQGLHREQLVLFDLYLDDDFEPIHCDGEISASIRMTWAEFRAAVADRASFKYSSLLACQDLIVRLSHLGVTAGQARPIRSCGGVPTADCDRSK